jgi:sugar phosphate isomerase/epimerase
MELSSIRFAVVAAALGRDLRQVPQLARQSGFSGLLFDAYLPELSVPDLSQSGRRELLHLLSMQEQRLVGLRVGLGANGLGPGADVDQALSRVERAMEAGAMLQAPLVCVDLGPLPEPPRQEKPKAQIGPEQAGLIIVPTLAAAPAPEATREPVPAEIDPTFAAQVDGALAEMGRTADRYSVTVALRSDLSSLAALERALRQASCPWFGVDLDPVAVLRDAWSLDETFSRFGPLIRHVRARDAVRGAGGRTQAAVIGRGAVKWEEVVAALDDAGYRGWMTVDSMELTDRAGAAVCGGEYLRRME